MGGVLDSTGNEHILFGSGSKQKNDYLADLIKEEYDDNVQVWKGKINGNYFGEEIIKDPKNFNRTFQIQECTINVNQSDTNVTMVEIRPSGLEGLNATINVIEWL